MVQRYHNNSKDRQKLITTKVPGTEESASNFVFDIKIDLKSKVPFVCYLVFTLSFFH